MFRSILCIQGILKGSSLNTLKSKPIPFCKCNYIGQETAIHYRKIYGRLENANCSLSWDICFLLFQPPLEKKLFHLVFTNSPRRFNITREREWIRNNGYMAFFSNSVN